MKYIIFVLFGLVFLIILICLLWRFISNKRSLPCPAWLHWLLEIENPFTRANHSKVIIDNLDIKPGMTILDAGCGPGRLTIPIAQNIGSEGEIVAMDIQNEMLEKVKEKAKKANLQNVRFINANLGADKLGNNQYDRIILVTVLGEIVNKEVALKEIFNALKPEGILSITETIFDPHFQSSSKISLIANSVGFKQKKIIGNRLAFTMQFEKPF